MEEVKNRESRTSTKTKWTIDTMHSQVAFHIKHMMISNVRGVFKKFGAVVYTTGLDFTTAKVDFWMDPDSIDTFSEQRDEHLRGRDFFDTRNHKQITFVSDAVKKREDNHRMYELWGDLTIRGITKRVKLDVEFGGVMKDPYGKEKAGFTVRGVVNRKDWGLTWNKALEAGGALLGEEVAIRCEAQLMNVTND
ncbi:MAG TPA: YceI family protein [Bacteroidia bacterium]